MTIPVYQCYMFDGTRRSHRRSNSVEAILDKSVADSSISGSGYGHELGRETSFQSEDFTGGCGGIG